MKEGWVVAEVGTVVDSHADVRASVLGKKVEFADNGMVVPFFDAGWTVFVRVEDLVYGGFSCFAIGQASVMDNGVNEPGLDHMDSPLCIFGDSDAKKILDGACVADEITFAKVFD